MCKCTDGHKNQGAATSSAETNSLRWTKPCVPVLRKPRGHQQSIAPLMSSSDCFQNLFLSEGLPPRRKVLPPGLMPWGGTLARGKPHSLSCPCPETAEAPAAQLSSTQAGAFLAGSAGASLCKRTSLSWNTWQFFSLEGHVPCTAEVVPVGPSTCPCGRSCPGLPTGCSSLRCDGPGMHTRPAECAVARCGAWVIGTAMEC